MHAIGVDARRLPSTRVDGRIDALGVNGPLDLRRQCADGVNFTDQLDFDEILGRGAVDDGHHGVRLGRSEADRQQIDVGVRSLGLAERELH